MVRKLKMFLLVAMLVFGFAQAAHADLTAIGPLDAATGFPTFVQDQNGLQLEPCGIIAPDGLVPPGNLPPCPLLEVLDPIGGFVAANIAEMFYYVAEAEIIAGTGERFRFRAIIEGAGGLLINGVRLDLRNIVTPGDYTISAVPPFLDADFTVTLPAGDTTVFPGGEIIGAAPLFLGAIPGPVQLFVGNGTGIFVDPALGNFLGDGATLAPLDNLSVLTVTGPFGPGGANATASTPDFMVQGKIGAQVVAMTVDSATYARDTAGHVDVIATAPPTASLFVTGGPNLSPTLPVAMTTDNLGKFFAHIVPFPDASTLPPVVSVRGVLPGALPTDPVIETTIDAPLIDVVTVTKAEYNAFDGTLTIEASSSDVSGAPVLTAVGFGPLVGGQLVVPALSVPVPPARVRVTSSAGGAKGTDVSVVSTSVRRANYNQAAATWDIRGDSTMPVGTPVTASLTRGNQLIGSANVRALGKFTIFIATPGLVPQPGDTVTVQSAGDRMIFPVRFRP